MKKYISLPVLLYLRFFARLQIKKINPTIIGITGSAGKTSTRILVSKVLRDLGTVKESHKANSESGIPLNILGLSLTTFSPLDWLRVILLAPFAYLFNWKKYDYYVVEMGIDSPHSPKNMKYLLTIISPHVGVVINAGLVHTENFDPLVKDRNPKRREKKLVELIAKEKGRLVTSMDGSKVAVLNADQKEIINLEKNTKARVLSFGKKRDSMVRIKSFERSGKNTEVEVSYNSSSEKIVLKDNLLDGKYAYTIGATVSVGVALGMPLSKVARKIESSFTLPPGRWSIFEGIKNSKVIDSSYNASPMTMKEALESLKKLASRSRKIAVVGDMRELGKEAKQSHKDLATWIAANANEAHLFGQETKEHTLPILQKKGFNVNHHESMDELISSVKSNLKRNSWILIKGSQNTIFLERVVEALIKDKKDSKKLCRRGKYWDKIRSKTP